MVNEESFPKKSDGRENNQEERRIDEDTGVVLTPEEVEKQKKEKADNPNWWREQR